MATYKSDQETKRTATPPKMLATNEMHGRVRIAYFTYTVPTGNAAVDDLVQLATIPPGARLLGGHLAFEAMSTGGGAASVQIGDGTTADKYLGTTSVDAAGTAVFGTTSALAFGQELTAETTITAKVVTEAWAATKKLHGFVKYVMD